MRRKRHRWLWALLLPSLALAAPPTGEDRLHLMQSTEQRLVGCRDAPEQLAAAVKVCDGGSNHRKVCAVGGDCPSGQCRRAIVRVISLLTDPSPYDILPSDAFLADNGTRLRILVAPYAKNGRKYQITTYAQTIGNQILACDVRVDVGDPMFKPQ